MNTGGIMKIKWRRYNVITKGFLWSLVKKKPLVWDLGEHSSSQQAPSSVSLGLHKESNELCAWRDAARTHGFLLSI